MLDRESFIQKYRLENSFYKAEKKGLTWGRLTEIYEDYIRNLPNYEGKIEKILTRLKKGAPSEAKIIYGRPKKPEHLIEKIIRKVGKEDKAKYEGINKNNYNSIITDLIGIRILVLKKEDWKAIDRYIHKRFSKFLECPVAYVCYGDRDIYDKSFISTRYTNKGYRSQHYIIKTKQGICEIQVRTLAEEVYGEYDHKVRYPYRLDSTFLARYNRIISKLTSDLDDLISTSLTMKGQSIDILDENFSSDTYRDWSAEVDECNKKQEEKKALEYFSEQQGIVNAIKYAREKILLRER